MPVEELLYGACDKKPVSVYGKPQMIRAGNGYVVYVLKDSEGRFVNVLHHKPGVIDTKPRVVKGTYYRLIHTIIAY